MDEGERTGGKKSWNLIRITCHNFLNIERDDEELDPINLNRRWKRR